LNRFDPSYDGNEQKSHPILLEKFYPVICSVKQCNFRKPKTKPMSDFSKLPLNKVVRGAKRASYDRETIFQILDHHFICHIGYDFEGTILTLPTGYGRVDDTLYLHGAIKNRMLDSLLQQPKISATVTLLDGLVLARSVFHHSFNYRSVVVFGKARLVKTDEEKLTALHCITENIIPGRWNEARVPSPAELKATQVIALEISEASAKIRSGGPIDDDEDYSLDVWAGTIPLATIKKEPVPDEKLNPETGIPPSVSAYTPF